MQTKSFNEILWNLYYFFQPVANSTHRVVLALHDQPEVFPNPLDKYRIPVPRLVPPGSSKTLNKG